MKATALNLLDDLRRRKLLPVAVLLLVAVLALPLFALKSTATPAPTPTAPAATAQAASEGLPSPQQALNQTDKPLVSLAVLEEASNLEEYSNRNPFKPLEQVNKTGDTGTPAPGADAASTSGGTSSGGGGASSGGGSTSGGGSGDTGASPGSSTPPSTTSTTPSPQPETTPKSDTDAQDRTLTYALDATLRGPSKTLTYRRLPKLQAMPGALDPLIVYLGIDSTGKNAVFLVDASLSLVEGEAVCTPSNAVCGTMKLQPGQVAVLQNAQGARYILSVDQIRAVSVASAAKASQRRDRAARASAKASSASSTPRRRFSLPVITDLFTKGAA